MGTRGWKVVCSLHDTHLSCPEPSPRGHCLRLGASLSGKTENYELKMTQITGETLLFCLMRLSPGAFLRFARCSSTPKHL